MNQLYTPIGIDAKLDAVPSQNNIESKVLYQPITPHPNRFRGGLGRGIATALTISLVYIVTACAGMQPKPDFYPEKGADHTLTYIKDGKEVTAPDLNGEWSAIYFEKEDIVKITQKNDNFTGTLTKGNKDLGPGSVTISGRVYGNIVECHTHWISGKTTYFLNRLSDKFDVFQCQGLETRTYKRID